MRQRRRAERGHFAPPRDRSQPALTRRDQEGRQRRLLLAGAGFILLVIVGMLAYGWFSTSYQPPRKIVAEVGTAKIKLEDVKAYTQLGGSVTGVLNPNDALNTLRRDALFEQRLGILGITFTPEDVERAIAVTFEPAGDGDVPETLGPEGRDNFNQFLDVLRVDEDSYRAWTKGNLSIIAVQEHFVALQPETVEQVFVQWLVTASSVTAQEAIDRILAGEDFGEIATEFNIESTLTPPDGEVGWVPRGAVPELDAIIFDGGLPLDSSSGPHVTNFGSMVLQITQGPSEQPLTDLMASRVALTEFQSWVDVQANGLFEEGSLRGDNLDTDDRDWVLDQLS